MVSVLIVTMEDGFRVKVQLALPFQNIGETYVVKCVYLKYVWGLGVMLFLHF